MPREFKRSDRVADALQRELAELLRMEVKDPRVGMVNITGAEVSRDLSSAKVFVTFIGVNEAAERDAALAALNGAAGFLRVRLGEQIRMRVIPKLTFIFDGSGDRGQQVAALIDLALAADHKRQAEGD
ncbi:MAG TPA: 30S ribosome-binding factor RbfA [Porticoccaceae bacterium]|nr:30S ribosome-binding factor RbfA [Porticoccaceae bacterium]